MCLKFLKSYIANNMVRPKATYLVATGFIVTFLIFGSITYVHFHKSDTIRPEESDDSATISEANRKQLSHATTVENFPYQVSIQYEGNHVCSGSIVSRKHVLTNAQCFANRNSSLFSVKAGTTDWTQGGNNFIIDEIIMHEEFHHIPMKDGKVTMNDIAIVTLKDQIHYNERRQAIGLNGNLKLAESTGEVGTLSGWGLEELDKPDELSMVMTPIEPSVMCDTAYRDYALLERGMMCAGFYGYGKKTPCLRDVGAPLVAKGSLVGMWSWGWKCTKTIYPSAFTNVAYFRLWIREKIDL